MAAGDLDELRIVGGHPALDLANTVAPREPTGTEYLKDPDALLTWAKLVGLLTGDEAAQVAEAWTAAPVSGETALHDTLTLRALVDPVLAGRDLEALTWRWTEAIARSALEPAGDGHARLNVGTEAAHRIPDRLADAIVDLIRRADLSRLHACPRCGFLFLDRSRNGSRRWCSMDDCGTAVKSSRLTERRRNATRSTSI
jgi:predicted RNA-binding Zn ribbon-like protein